MLQLLQTDVTSTIKVLEKTSLTTLLELLLKGGWAMPLLLIFSIIAMYATIERWIVLWKSTPTPQHWQDIIQQKILEGDLQGAKLLCEQKPYAIAKIVQAGIEQMAHASKAVATVVENTAQIEIHRLEKNLSLLGTIAGAAPMLGFLGTVTGMIRAFMAMAQTANHISPQLLSGGIYEAMITTATGLVVGILAYLAYNQLLTCIQNAKGRIEYAANQFIIFVDNIPAM